MEHIRLKRLGIDTYQTPIIFMREDCTICKAEGFEAHSRLLITLGKKHLIATMNAVRDSMIDHGEAGLSEAAWRLLDAKSGDIAVISHAPPLESLRHVRSKIYGNRISQEMAEEIIADIVHGSYSDTHLAAFIAACGGKNLDVEEIVALTSAMINSGERLLWHTRPVMDKHSVGGLPGNRTTPIVVAIVAALGLAIPKTSSRAITSPAGTADVMETMTPVFLDLVKMRRVVESEGGCLVWGGSARLSPADDILIRVERSLDIDSDGQLVASVLSKKIAAGSTHVIIDMPFGPTAKVRSHESAVRLSSLMQKVAARFNLKLECLLSDGTQPVGRGMGPSLEAQDVLAVLRNSPDAPADLREKSLQLSASIIDLSEKFPAGEGIILAEKTLANGAAYKKFLAICTAQGGFREPEMAAHQIEVTAPKEGVIKNIDNRRLSRMAKFSGAPRAAKAGAKIMVRLGQSVVNGQPLFSLHAESSGELSYALEYYHQHPDMILVEEA